MRLVLLDAQLEHIHGHHALYDRVIAREIRQRGHEAVIIANQRLERTEMDGVPVFPLLETTCYRQFSQDPVFGAYDDVSAGNRAVFDELSALPQDFFRRSDLVVVHTVSQTSLLGLVTWIASLPQGRGPRFCIFLMLPSGIGFDADGRIDMDNPAAATAYREAFRRARDSGADVTFMASGHQHARQFSALAEEDIPPHALLTSFDDSPSGAALKQNQVLLFAGDAKMNKGLGTLPELVQELCPHHPEYQFVIHANPGPAWGEALTTLDKLRRIAGSHPNLDLRLGVLDTDEYGALLTDSALVFLPYDPEEYRRKSSGVVWEAIASQSFLIVPADTWLEQECRHWRAAHATYARHETADMVQALSQALNEAPAQRGQVETAARRFVAANGVKALTDQLADIWVAHSASLGSDSSLSSTIAPRDFGTEGWHALEETAGQQVRWSSQTAQLPLTLPGIGSWTISLHGPFCFSEDQLRGARLCLDNAALETNINREDDGRWTLSAEVEETATSMPRRQLELELGWVQTEGAHGRTLGLLTAGLDIEESLQQLGWRSVPMTPVGPAANSEGWSPQSESGSWNCPVQPGYDCIIAFRLAAPLEAQFAKACKLFVNGQPAGLRIQQRRGHWQGQALLTAGSPCLNQAKTSLDIDLVLPAPARIQMQEMLWLRPGHADEAQLPAAAQKVCATEPSQQDTADPTETPVLAESAPSAPPLTVKLPEFRETAAQWSCSQAENFDKFSFVNLRVQGFQVGGRTLADFYVKVLRGENFYALELREADGAFQLLDRPFDEAVKNDDWGKKVSFFVTPEGAHKGPRPDAVAEGISGLITLLEELPSGIEVSNPPDLPGWKAAALALAKLQSTTLTTQ